METLGQELKRRREEKKISLQEMSDATRIGIRFLQAIEADDYSALPGGIYSRSFIKAYARFVKMDEEEALGRFRKVVNTSTVEDEPAESFSSKDFQREPSQLFLIMTVLVLLGVIAGGSWLAVQYFSKPSSPEVAPAQPQPQPAPVQPSPDTQQASLTTPAAPAELSLVFKTVKDCWVSVKSGDSKAQELIIPGGETREFKTSDSFLITVGDLTAVKIELNGQPIKLPSKDGISAKKITITKENAKDFTTAEAVKPAITPAVTPEPATSATPATPDKPVKPPVLAGAPEQPASTEKPNATKPAGDQKQKPVAATSETKPATPKTITNSDIVKPKSEKPADDNPKPTTKPEGGSGD